MKIYKISDKSRDDISIPYLDEYLYESSKIDKAPWNVEENKKNDPYIHWGHGHLRINMPSYLTKYLEQRFGPMTPIGSGIFGVAYLMQDNTVLKLTSDTSEVLIAIQQKSDPKPFLATVYGIYVIQNEYDTGISGTELNVYGIKMEKLTPLSASEQTNVAEELNRFRNVPLRDLITRYENENNAYSNLSDISQEVLSLRIKMGQAGHNFEESHHGNIGRTDKGILKVFDMGQN